VKLASEQHKVKSQIGSILLKTAIVLLVPFNYFNNLDFTPIRNRIFTRDGRSIVLDYESPPGTSLEETDRMLVEVEKIIHASRSAAYSRRTGTQMGFITEPNRDYLIQLKKDRSKTSNDVIDEIRVKSKPHSLHYVDFGQVIG
jgi:multidrug efflux pump subunit AcrB